MNNNANAILGQAINSMFLNNEQLLSKHLDKSKRTGNRDIKSSKKELELALAVLLVDLASCDQQFDMKEYLIISNGLRRIFGTKKTEVQALVNQANLVLSNLRGTDKFASLLQDNLAESEKKAIMDVINEVIQADGVEDGFETYLRHKFSTLLGIDLEQKNLEPPKATE